MANIGSDLSGKRINEMSTFKKLTGDDQVAAEPKGVDAFNFRNRVTLIFSSNDPPTLGDKGPAVAERLYHVPFTNKHSDEDPELPDKDRNLKAKLTTDEEQERLLALAIEGAQRLLENGETSIPESKEERMEAYESLSDPVQRVGGLIEHTGASDDIIVKEHAHMAYLSVADEMASVKQLSKSDFSREMTRGPLAAAETGQSRRHHDEDSPKPAWKGVQWVDGAERHLPDNVAARYGLAGDEEADANSSSDEETVVGGLTPPDAIEPGTVVDVVAPVTYSAAGEDARPWLAEEGEIDDGGAGVEYHARAHSPVLEAGETYILRDCKVVRDENGFETLLITTGTEIEHVSQDTVSTPLDTDSDDDDDGDDDPDAGGDGEDVDSDTTTSDGEDVPDSRTIDRVEKEMRRRAEDGKRPNQPRCGQRSAVRPGRPGRRRARDRRTRRAREVVEDAGGDALHVPGEGIEAWG
nr:DUF5906 domain-containing protein [Natrinema caseinilyticum]